MPQLEKLKVSVLAGSKSVQLEKLKVSVLATFEGGAGEGNPRVGQFMAQAYVTSDAVVTRRVGQFLAQLYATTEVNRRVAQFMAQAYVGTLSKFEELILTPAEGRVYLIDAQPLSDALATIRQTLSQNSQKPVWDARLWRSRIIDAFSYNESIFDNRIGSAAEGRRQTGVARVANADGALDSLADYHWHGHEVRILIGEEHPFPYEDFQELFVGLTDGITVRTDSLLFRLRDPGEKLDRPLSNLHKFTGKGGIDGGEQLNGTAKPLCLGPAKNVTPVWLDVAPRNIGMVNDGPIQAIENVYSGLDTMDFDGDKTVDEIFDLGNDPALGKYFTCLAAGLIRVGLDPAKTDYPVTVDLQGHVDPALGYIAFPGQMVEFLATTYSGAFTTSELDLGSHRKLDAEAPYALSYYTAGQDLVLGSVVNEVLDSVMGYIRFTRTGLMQVGRFGFTDPVTEITRDHIEEIEREETEPPSQYVELSYDRNWSVFDTNDLDDAETDVQKQRLSYVTKENRRWVGIPFPNHGDPLVSVKNPSAVPRKDKTLIATSDDAQVETNIRTVLFTKPFDVYRVTVAQKQYRIRAGDTVTLTYPRWGLSGGRRFVVIERGENSSSFRTTLRLWGLRE